ncbi:MAG: thioredoxin domain-containing protein [Syntrophorhabdales bacterium]
MSIWSHRNVDTFGWDQYTPRMAPAFIMARCPHCGAKNRIPAGRWGDEGAVCGRCKSPLHFPSLFPDHPVSATDATFAREVLGFQGPVLAEFYSPFCGHCQRLAPVLDDLATVYAGRVKFVLVNIDQNRLTQSQYGVNATPTLLFFRRGRLVDRVVGALPRHDLTRHLDSLAAGT